MNTDNIVHTITTISKMPASTYIIITGRTRTPGNLVDIFSGTIREAVDKAQETWPDADCHSVKDWLDILTSDYRSVQFEA